MAMIKGALCLGSYLFKMSLTNFIEKEPQRITFDDYERLMQQLEADNKAD